MVSVESRLNRYFDLSLIKRFRMHKRPGRGVQRNASCSSPSRPASDADGAASAARRRAALLFYTGSC
jgi:hypothetical protein